MQYYTFELDNESKDLCTVATLFGKFKYNRLPMDLKCSPGYTQEVMEKSSKMLKMQKSIDNNCAFSHSWDIIIALMRTMLTKLQDNGFIVNPLNGEWAFKKTDWLGYWLTPIGLKQWKKKIEAVLRMQPLTSFKLL
jgi:hypothetical protein